ncbi:MAG TPA: manganese catalase family protein [Terriglobales bacterium]|nr:manganese catalase family protein [Terriglobales bacterium]
MFFHDKRMQYNAKPSNPDPVYAKKLQEILGGQWGEITVSMQYLFQGYNCRGPAKYRDMILDIGTEELAHVEMLATMIARLLEKAPVSEQEAAAKHPIVGGVMGGASSDDLAVAATNPQHFIVTGGGASATDSVGYPWTSRYIIASGNLLADFRANVTAESQGRLQATRLYEMTDDPGVRDLLSFLIARDTFHQFQWLRAIEEVQRDGIESTPVPVSFPRDLEHKEAAVTFWNCSQGTQSQSGAWAKGNVDGGEVRYLERPTPMGPEPELAPPEPRLHSMNPNARKVA